MCYAFALIETMHQDNIGIKTLMVLGRLKLICIHALTLYCCVVLHTGIMLKPVVGFLIELCATDDHC